MGAAKPVSLSIRPFQVSHLCFEVGGILEVLVAQLGTRVQPTASAAVPRAFDFPAFYTILGSMPTQAASGFIMFTTNPAAGTTIILNGTTWTFVSSLTTGNQILIGATLAATLASAVSALQGSTDANTKKFIFSASSNVLILTAATGGSAGNTLTISTTVPGAAASGTTLLGGDSSRLLYNFLQIEAAVAPFALAALRKEARKAALSSAINARQNAYFAKYANAPAVISKMIQYYSDSSTLNPTNWQNSKPHRLFLLAGQAQVQWDYLAQAYTNDSRAAVVKHTCSTLTSDTTSYGYSAADGQSAQVIASDPGADQAVTPPPNPPQPWAGAIPGGIPSWPPPAAQTLNAPTAVKQVWTFPNTSTGLTYQESTNYQETASADKAHQDQTIVNTDYGYRVPYIEAEAQNHRAQISLMDQQFAQFMYGQNLPNLATVFQNELNNIDANVFRLQVAYLNTILMSPIAGIVTGVYKNPGDSVRAGEPVVRVEDNSTIYLVATVIYRGPIVVGSAPPAPPVPNSTVTVQTKLFGSSNLPNPLTGTVVSARGHRDEDKWELIVKCNNLDPSGNPIFPLGYHFDYDDTEVTIS